MSQVARLSREIFKAVFSKMHFKWAEEFLKKSFFGGKINLKNKFGLSAKKLHSFSKIFKAILSKPHYFCPSKGYWVELLLRKVIVFVIFGPLVKKLRPYLWFFLKTGLINFISRVQRNTLKIFPHFFNKFRLVSEVFSCFWQKCFGGVFKTALFVSKRTFSGKFFSVRKLSF